MRRLSDRILLLDDPAHAVMKGVAINPHWRLVVAHISGPNVRGSFTMQFSASRAIQPTRGGEEAARLLSELGWAESTWTSRTSQLPRWLRFCDEDIMNPLPATEGDVMAYIGYLSIDGSVSPESLPQYLSAVSRYQELHFLPSPIKSPMVKALVRAYKLQYDLNNTTPRSMRIGLPARVFRSVVDHGLQTENFFDRTCCAMVVMNFFSNTFCLHAPRHRGGCVIRARSTHCHISHAQRAKCATSTRASISH